MDSFRYRTATQDTIPVSSLVLTGGDSKGIHTLADCRSSTRLDSEPCVSTPPQHPLPSLQHVTARFWDGKPVSVLTHSWQGCKAGGTEPPCLQPLWRRHKAGFASGRWVWLRLQAAQALSFRLFLFLVPTLSTVNVRLSLTQPCQHSWIPTVFPGRFIPRSLPDLTWHEFSLKTVELLRCVQDLGLKQNRFGNEYLCGFSLLFQSPLCLAKNDFWTLNPPKWNYRQRKQHWVWFYAFCTSLINTGKADYLL